MEKMNNLRDLLQHEIQDLYSAEEQIIAALPAMIEKASNKTLKTSLKEHLAVSEKQKKRLDQVMQLMGEAESGTKKKGLLGLFSGKHKCKGMEGIISEGNKIMAEDMDADVMDAAIIASAQKVEHYEICGYGTARSFAVELGLTKVAELLEATLDEEYEADDSLTFLAESRINKQAEKTSGGGTGSSSARGRGGRETSQDTAKRRSAEMEPVSASRSGSSSRQSNARSVAPKGGATRSSSGRTPAKKNTATKAASRTNGNTRSRGR